MAGSRLSYLLQVYAEGEASSEEFEELFTQIREAADDGPLQEWLAEEWARIRPGEPIPWIDWERMFTAIVSSPETATRPKVVKLRWPRIAAIFLGAALTTGLALYLSHRHNGKSAPDVGYPVGRQSQQDILPGGEKAILTLSDGRRMVLDSISQDTVLKEGVALVASANGRLAYNVGNHPDTLIAFNTLTTPRGGQYQLLLPDGTKVWLNAASSITYPTAFTGKNRRVTISGEAYLEVSRKPEQPFIVSIMAGGRGGNKEDRATAGKGGNREDGSAVGMAGNKGDGMAAGKGENKEDRETVGMEGNKEDGSAVGMEVEVLGTSFNISAYDDEPAMLTTLLEGSVAVNAHGARRVIRPGEQASLSFGGQTIGIREGVDTDQVLAWKNGLFSFTDADVAMVMRQIARWYNVDVSYEEGIPKGEFNGKIGKSLTLEQMLTVLARARIHYTIEPGNKLIIRP